MIDIALSLDSVARREHVTSYRGVQVLKFHDDLMRYESLIERTRPELIVETGSNAGGSAVWFADRPGVEFVVSVDLTEVPPLSAAMSPRVVWLGGRSSTDPMVVGLVASMAIGRRTMVVLDSDHSAEHVEQEIRHYGPMVTRGCALVVEDGLFDHATEAQLMAEGMPGLNGGRGPGWAIAATLAGHPGWQRVEFEDIPSKISQNVDGWWIKL